MMGIIIILAVIGLVTLVTLIVGVATPWLDHLQELNEEKVKIYFAKRKGKICNAVVDWEKWDQLVYNTIGLFEGELTGYSQWVKIREQLVQWVKRPNNV